LAIALDFKLEAVEAAWKGLGGWRLETGEDVIRTELEQVRSQLNPAAHGLLVGLAASASQKD
jgi:hypothetical protein